MRPEDINHTIYELTLGKCNWSLRTHILLTPPNIDYLFNLIKARMSVGNESISSAFCQLVIHKDSHIPNIFGKDIFLTDKEYPMLVKFMTVLSQNISNSQIYSE